MQCKQTKKMRLTTIIITINLLYKRQLMSYVCLHNRSVTQNLNNASIMYFLGIRTTSAGPPNPMPNLNFGFGVYPNPSLKYNIIESLLMIFKRGVYDYRHA